MKPDKCPYDTGNARITTGGLEDQATCLEDCKELGKYFSCYFLKRKNEVVREER